MSAMYRVSFENGSSVVVHSADARSMKTKDVRASYTKARKKAQTTLAKKGGGHPTVTGVACIG